MRSYTYVPIIINTMDVKSFFTIIISRTGTIKAVFIINADWKQWDYIIWGSL